MGYKEKMGAALMQRFRFVDDLLCACDCYVAAECCEAAGVGGCSQR
jgi:hypothetical protein